MRKKKSSFLTFCFSCMPGAGQMFLGFFKEGISLMVMFFGIIAISEWLYLGGLAIFAVVVWFYAFFDAMNKNSMSDENFEKLEDHYLWIDNLQELPKVPTGKLRKIVAIVLIVLGVYMLSNSVIAALANAGIYISYEISQFIRHYIPQLIVAFFIITLGIRMIIGKKESLKNDDIERYMEGREEK